MVSSYGERAWQAQALIVPLAIDDYTIDMLAACRICSDL